MSESAYGTCKGCGTMILTAPIAGETEKRTHCSVCKEKQGQAPKGTINVHPQKRPPYERPSAINPGE